MVKINIKLQLKYDKEDLKAAILATLPLEDGEICRAELVRRSLNVSDKTDIHYDATVAIEVSEEREAGLLKMKKKVSPYPDYTLTLPHFKGNTRPIVVGAGPAGLFAALALAESGARPIILERGLDVDKRGEKLSLFTRLGVLDTECNVQFGEGGAGTYSDGKLKVGAMDKYKMKVLSEFVECGATEDILYSTSAHLGTDKLSGIVKKLRQKIISLGGEVHFGERLTDILTKEERVVGVITSSGGERREYECDSLILATGHSAKDTFDMLYRMGAVLEPRGFGIGVRIEHPREYINELIYGKGHRRELDSASYHLVTHLDSGRSVYSFCMCPGGSVVPAASEDGGVVTNGMSEYLRNNDNSNAAFLVSVTPRDFGSEHPLAGIEMQRKIERRAYLLTSSYKAPAERLGNFVERKTTSSFGVMPSYPIGVEAVQAEEYLPSFVCEALRASISDFDEWLGGFYYPDAAITGPETRTTSPVRVTRDERGEALGIKGLYPAGEGAGYSGGIVSSARDGIIAAENLLNRLNS